MSKLTKGIKNNLPKTRKGKISMLIFAILLPIGGGIAAGILLSNFLITNSADYTNIDSKDLEVNTDNLMQKYESLKSSNSNYEEYLKPYEVANISMQLLYTHDNVRIFTDGIAHASGAGVDQTIRACLIKDKNEYLEESLSKSSMVAVGTRTYLHQDGSIYLYRGQTTSATTATWPDEHYEYTSEEYTDAFGKTPVIPSIYVVSKKTTLDGSTFVKDGEGYKLNIKLDPLKGVVRYVRQMKSISDLADYPAFEYVELEYTLDENLLVKNIQVNEKYSAKISAIIGSVIEARLNIDYEVDNVISIPSIKEEIAYPEGVIK